MITLTLEVDITKNNAIELNVRGEISATDIAVAIVALEHTKKILLEKIEAKHTLLVDKSS